MKKFIAVNKDNATETYTFNAKDTENALDWVIAHLDCSKAWTVYSEQYYKEQQRTADYYF